MDTVLLQPASGRRPLGTGDRSARCTPLAFPWHPSRAGISPSQEGAEQAARPAPGQGERCLVERTPPFAIRSPGGSRVFVSARSREEKPGSCCWGRPTLELRAATPQAAPSAQPGSGVFVP